MGPMNRQILTVLFSLHIVSVFAQVAPTFTERQLKDAAKALRQAEKANPGITVAEQQQVVKSVLPNITDYQLGQVTVLKENDDSPISEVLKHFGAGVSLKIDLGDHDRVKRASLDANKVVRVEEDDNAQIRFTLEAHATPWRLFGQNTKIGPFVALQMGGEDIIDAMGGGIMISVRRSDEDKLGSVNLGFGVVVDPNVQVLGDGIEANEVLPAGDSIRFKETVQVGALFLVSFGF
jgi:hypothetical protein